MEKRRILVISYYYAPQRNIASLRWSKMVKYITAKGWEADVITSSSIEAVDALLAAEIGRMGNIIFIDHKNRRFAPTQRQKEQLEAVKCGEYSDVILSSGPTAAAPVDIKKRTGFAALRHSIGMSAPLQYYSRLKTISDDMKRSEDFAAQAENYIRSHGGLGKYDAVISTFGPVADVILALKLKKRYPEVPLIMDFRDPMDSITGSAGYRRRMLKMQKKICRLADAVCTVTKGAAKEMSPYCSGKLHTITNGFDREDGIGVEPYETEKLTLCYTGSVYLKLDDFTPLWKCIKELADSGEIDLGRTAFVYAGTNGEFFRDDMAAHGIESILENRGRIDRADSIRLQKSSDALVLSRWNMKNSQGVICGKFLEYMLADKPIISLINGEIGGSEIRSIMEKGDLGVTYEAAAPEQDGPALRDYILKLYKQKFEGIPSGYAPDKNVVDSFAYNVLAGDYMDLIESVIKTENSK